MMEQHFLRIEHRYKALLLDSGNRDWTVCGNGTITSGAHIGYDVLGDTMLIVDGAGSTRHSTNGTSFTEYNPLPLLGLMYVVSR